MQNQIKTSVIIPVYNVEEYLNECVQSVLAQTQKEIEIILVDDGSTDSSGIICDNYAKQDARIVVIHKQNGGLVSARKAGMRVAKGEYIYNLDGDDWIEPNMLESLLKVAEETQVDYVQSGYIYKTGTSVKKCDFPEFVLRENITGALSNWLSGTEKILSSQVFTKLYEKDVFCNCYESVPDDMNLGEDQIMFVIALSKVKTIASVSDCFYHYRIRENSLSHLVDTIELVKKEDKLTWYMYDLLYRLFPHIDRRDMEKWILQRSKRVVSFFQTEKETYTIRYNYSNVNELIGTKIAIYGAGAVGRDYVTQLSRYEQISIVLWVDQNNEKYNYPWRKVVCAVEELKECQYDYVIIAIKNKEIQENVRERLIKEFGVEGCKIRM